MEGRAPSPGAMDLMPSMLPGEGARPSTPSAARETSIVEAPAHASHVTQYMPHTAGRLSVESDASNL